MSVYIVVEGVDLAGKTTFINNLKEALLFFYPKIEVIPSILENTRNGQLIRKKLSNKNTTEEELDELIENYMLNEMYKNNLVKDYLLNNTDVIIQDRTIVSTYVYQNFTPDKIKEYEKMLKYISTPDCIVFIDTPLDVIFKRLSERKSKTDRYENINKITNNVNTYRSLFKTDIRDERVEVINEDKENTIILSFFNHKQIISINNTNPNSMCFKFILEKINHWSKRNDPERFRYCRH